MESSLFNSRVHRSFLPGPFGKALQYSDMIFDSFIRHHRQPTQLTALAISSPSVPVELYRPIVEAVRSWHDLYNLLFVSKAMRSESERILYRYITIKSGTHKPSMRLLKHLSECQRVALHVRNLVTLKFPLKGGRNKIRNLVTLSSSKASSPEIAAEEYFRTLNRALCALQFLQHLHLENGFFTNDTFARPSFSLLSGCTFQLKSLSMVHLYDINRTDLENQKCIERLSIRMADSNSLFPATFPRLSALTLLQSASFPDPESIKRIKTLYIDIVTMQNSPAFQSPLINITSLTLYGYDSSIVVDIPHLFPSVRLLQLGAEKLTLRVLEERIEQIRGLTKLEIVHFASWTERKHPTQAIVSQWPSKLISVKLITIQDNTALTRIEWVRGTEQWVKHKLQKRPMGMLVLLQKKNRTG